MTEPVEVVTMPISLSYDYTPGVATSEFLRGLVERRILGQRCTSCGKVYVQPKGLCPRCGIALTETFDLPDSGIVTTFCVVNIPFAGQAVECPYISASILFDGADVPIFHLVQEVPVHEARMGMRVAAVWADELSPNMTSIKYFAPTGEPDVPLDEVLARMWPADA
jgi:uncharacterized OB-fold protein